MPFNLHASIWLRRVRCLSSVAGQCPTTRSSIIYPSCSTVVRSRTYQTDRSATPYVQPLTESDVDSCTRLEEEAFPPHDRCTREKFAYRLKTWPDISLGMFVSPDTEDGTASAVDPGALTRRAILIGHICSTRSASPTVTDADMALPLSPGLAPSAGRTICLHSLAMLPAYQSRGLGRRLLTTYIQRMASAGTADRIAGISHAHLLRYYETFGFRVLGPSPAQFGGGGWFDLVIDFEKAPKKE